MFIFPKQLMEVLYKSTQGYEYVRIFSIPFILYYLESPFISAMTALGKTKQIMFVHLSDVANTPEVCLATFLNIAKKRNKDISKLNISAYWTKED